MKLEDHSLIFKKHKFSPQLLNYVAKTTILHHIIHSTCPQNIFVSILVVAVVLY